MALFGPLFAGLAFLTVLPVPRAWCGGARELGRSLPWFPAIGLAIGALVAALDAAFAAALPPLPAGVLTVVAMTGVSGGLHLDGLADTADGFLSARPRERVLEIMKDSRVGTMGVAAVVFVALLKVAAVSALAPAARFGTLLLMPLAGRTALVVMMAALRYVREDGLGTVFRGRGAAVPALVAAAVLGVVGHAAAGRPGLAAAAASVAATLAFAFWCRARIGGYTGDTLGAACELAELVPALAVLAAIQRGVAP